MKNLLERLKPEIANAINEAEIQYPLLVLELKNELSNLFYVSDLRYGSIVQLETYYLLAFNKIPSNGWENFNN